MLGAAGWAALGSGWPAVPVIVSGLLLAIVHLAMTRQPTGLLQLHANGDWQLPGDHRSAALRSTRTSRWLVVMRFRCSEGSRVSCRRTLVIARDAVGAVHHRALRRFLLQGDQSVSGGTSTVGEGGSSARPG